MPEFKPTLLATLADPIHTNPAVAAVFGSVADAGLLEQPQTVNTLVGSPRLSDDDLTVLARFLVRWEEESLARDCLLTRLFEHMERRKIALTEMVHLGAHLAATAPASLLRTASLEYLEKVGREDEFYALGVTREFNEQNYAAACRRGGKFEPPRSPANWQDWEEHGWWRVEVDWPIAELLFGLETAEEEVDKRLWRLQSPLVPAAETLQYFLLKRVWRAQATTLARVNAIGELIESIRNVPELAVLYDRALLVFRNHWRLLPMGELAAMAAEVYLDLCDLQREFEPDGPRRFPPLLEGMDVDHLKKNWRQGPERWALLAPGW